MNQAAFNGFCIAYKASGIFCNNTIILKVQWSLISNCFSYIKMRLLLKYIRHNNEIFLREAEKSHIKPIFLILIQRSRPDLPVRGAKLPDQGHSNVKPRQKGRVAERITNVKFSAWEVLQNFLASIFKTLKIWGFY